MLKHREEDAFMVPGMGAQPVPAPKYVAANDNVAAENGKDWGGYTAPEKDVAAVMRSLAGGQYIGLTRAGDPNGCADDLVTTTFAPLESVSTYPTEPASVTVTATFPRGPFIQLYSGRPFYPLDPQPEDVFIEDIAHGLANICRYSGATILHMSVAEHSVLIARWLIKKHFGPLTALHGLLHDAPEALSGFGDVGRPMKKHVPEIGYIEESIYRKAIAPAFGLHAKIPDVVHEVDSRIIADELVNLKPMDWHAKHNDPLGVSIGCWSPAVAEEEFLATYDALVRQVRRGV